MHTDYAKLAVEVLKAMYDHNSKSHSSVGRTELGPEQLSADQVASDLRVIYKGLTEFDS